MSASSDTNMCLVAILGVTALGFSAHHTYRYDKWRCLLPAKKDWFRVCLTWMLLGSTIGLFIWAAGWCYVKYTLGWTYIPGIGPMPVPPQMFEQKYRDLNTPLTIVFSLAVSLQSSLNAEEGLYWYSLMRAVRQPRSTQSWLKSYFFYAWIIISILCTALQCSLSWIHTGEVDLAHQLAVILTVDGAVEMVVMLSSSIVIWKFPAFLKDVKASGAGPEVRSRLHFYHEANKVRTFFRFMFAASMMILGIDALTTAEKINNTPLANDILSQIAFCSFFFVLIISNFLYLPRNWSPEKESRNFVMVGNGQGVPGGGVKPGAANQIVSGVALMSLLREAGQWDHDYDDVIEICDKTVTRDDAPFTPSEARTWDDESTAPAGDDSDINSLNELTLGVPTALENFMSPFDVRIADTTVPSEIKIHVEHEVRRHVDDDLV
ncbi:hypothetical protein CI109_103161 [Kwoniella shandongensis]|uniref:Uncharacterized protein n=1 Tax=Kwoniella shandongensis TaxID=1734106 RepID=A0A5M6CA85_9TREE|nr:uncharacterized protein CI109_000352 [Kwoniella shandongensis]KAA5531510.1 hypothetical protein CI109_000352 [Kwoniella shandongensis]